MGQVKEGSVLQAKGVPYTLMDLLGDEELVSNYLNGSFVTAPHLRNVSPLPCTL
jgi:phosphatidylserine decarboxylase